MKISGRLSGIKHHMATSALLPVFACLYFRLRGVVRGLRVAAHRLCLYRRGVRERACHVVSCKHII